MGFVRRSRKISGSSFIYNLLSACGNTTSSLQQQANEYACEDSIHISKEGLHKRFCKKSTGFVRAVLQQVISLHLSGMFPLQQPYSKICIKDSTTFSLDVRHASRFNGCGGSGSISAMHVQFEYDVLGGNIYDFDLRDATENDSKDADRKSDRLSAGILYIRDLGYVSEDIMEKTSQAGGYYVNRLKRNTFIYKTKDKKYPYSFSYLLKQMQRTGKKYHEMDVYLTDSDNPYRLVLVLVPDSVYRQRLER